MTTGSLTLGAVQGMRREMGTSGASIAESITFIEGSPDTLLTAAGGSDIAFDGINGQFYIAQGVGGSTWIKLGSVS